MNNSSAILVGFFQNQKLTIQISHLCLTMNLNSNKVKKKFFSKSIKKNNNQRFHFTGRKTTGI